MNLFWRAYNGHVLMVAFMIGLFAMVMIGLQQSLANMETSVKGSLSAVVFLHASVSDADAAALEPTLKTLDPEIQSIEYTSKAQAYQDALKDPNLAKSLQLLRTNPLPASWTIHFNDRAWWERADPTEKLKTVAAIQEIRWDAQARSLFISLHRWRLWTLRFCAFVGVVLMGWAFVGLCRFLSLQGNVRELFAHISVGLFGGALAWGLWGMGLRSIQADISNLHPAWVWLAPLAIGAVSALGCFGLDVRHAD